MPEQKKKKNSDEWEKNIIKKANNNGQAGETKSGRQFLRELWVQDALRVNSSALEKCRLLREGKFFMNFGT